MNEYNFNERTSQNVNLSSTITENYVSLLSDIMKTKDVGHAPQDIFGKVNIILNEIESLVKNSEQKEFLFKINEPIDPLIGREDSLDNLHKALLSNKTVVLHGVSGSGKTELARRYCWLHRKRYAKKDSIFYNNIIWLSAATEEILKKSFDELANELNVPENNLTVEEFKYSFSFRYNIYSKLFETKTLLVFDNVEEMDFLQNYLPTDNHQNNIYMIVVTSRNNWDVLNWETVLLEGFPVEESVLLAETLLNTAINKEEIPVLVETLGYLPLAIRMATAFINSDEQQNIPNFIECFKKEICDENSPFHNILSLILNKITNPLSLDILYISSYLSPENIPRDVFSQFCIDESERKVALDVILSYSLMDERGDQLNINRSVQRCLRSILRTPQKERIMEKVLDSIAWIEIHTDNGYEHANFAFRYITDEEILKYCNNATWIQQQKILVCLGKCGYLETIQKINNKEIFVDSLFYEPVLKFAVSNNNLDMVHYIFEHNNNLRCDQPNGTEDSLLHTAVRYNRESILNYFLEVENVNINVSNPVGWSPVQIAVVLGHLDIVKILRSRNATLNDKTRTGNTLLHLAAKYNHEPIVKYLLEIKVDVNCTDVNGWSAAHYATSFGHLNVLKLLIDKGAAINDSSHESLTLLHLAAGKNYESIVHYLLDNNIDLNYKDQIGFTALHYAALFGHLNILKLLIGRGVSVKNTTNCGFTTLHLATIKNQVPIVHYLLDNNVNLNCKDINGLTPLHYALLLGYLSILKIFIEEGVPLNKKMEVGLSLLHYSTIFNQEPIIKYILDNGVDVNYRDINGWSAAHYASGMGYLNVLKILINKGTPLSVKTNVDDTLVQLSLENDQELIAKYLLDNIVNVNCETERDVTPAQLLDKLNICLDHRALDGLTLLHVAAMCNHETIVSYLLDIGADINCKNAHGFSPAHLATQNGHLDMLKFFVNRGTPLGIKSTGDVTLLHLAVKYNQERIVEYLLNNKVDINSRNNFGCYPAHYAASHGHLNILKILKNRGVLLDVKTNNGMSLLHLAICKNQEQTVKYLLDNNVDVYCRDGDGICPVHYTAVLGHLNILELLKNRGTLLDVKTSKGLSLLHIAVANNQTSIINYLLDNKVDVNCKDDSGLFPIYYAVSHEDVNVLKIFSDRGISLNSFNLLHFATACNRPSIVKYLLDNNFDMYCQEDRGFTSAHVACETGNLNILKMFINKGCPFDVKTSYDFTLLQVATAYNQESVVKYLLDNNVDINYKNKDGLTAAHCAVLPGHLNILKILIDRGCALDIKTNDGLTLLQLAAAQNRDPIVKYLSDNDAGRTPADHSAPREQHDVINIPMEQDSPSSRNANRDNQSLLVKYFRKKRVVEDFKVEGLILLIVIVIAVILILTNSL